ncbi:DUF2441 domain-containing protein [Nitratireductor aquibiodomus]|uniref:DUF2441 domain-containing protein n=1 Tax=Nitratireductor aquibiodomus TaxID=204799 RepID=UPI0019D3840E|nr:DUF2441 domain-containing protein [Nitratireductor aquibiodomus]MBN7760292.1 DUF2441 domain-containing protein [Nitratireductor aquibiodomus]
MVEKIENKRLFHVTRELPYSIHPTLSVGDTISAFDEYNPFFAFYERPRTYGVHLEDGTTRQVPAMHWIDCVAKGLVQSPNALTAAQETAKHFQMLSRELLMEIIRLEEASDAPSRQTCLWLADSVEKAQYWHNRLGGTGRILEVEATGNMHTVDASLLFADADALSDIIRRARLYWRGQASASPEMEILFFRHGYRCRRRHAVMWFTAHMTASWTFVLRSTLRDFCQVQRCDHGRQGPCL